MASKATEDPTSMLMQRIQGMSKKQEEAAKKQEEAAKEQAKETRRRS